MTVRAKICGIREDEALAAALDGGAALIGFVFYPPSPRALVPQVAGRLARQVPAGIEKVGLFVDPALKAIETVLREVPLDVLQLHGAETAAQVTEIKTAFGLPVMKAIKLRVVEDLAEAACYEPVADRLLFDAKPPEDMPDALPGGNGIPFDWHILAAREFSRPWMLSGGLTAGNVARAVAETGARAVDVSSGVESAPGIKDPARIKAFLDAVRSL